MNNKLATFASDAVAVLIFAILARLAHNTADAPFTLLNVVNTFWPFLIGTVIAWGLIYRRATVENAYGRTISLGVIVWLCTVITGLGIWGIKHGAVPHWSFVLVATVMSGLLLLGWRVIAKYAIKTV